MALINTLRRRMGKIVVGVVAFSMFAFILTDLFQSNSALLGGSDRTIAEIAGTDISYEQFQARVDQLSATFAINNGRDPLAEEMETIREQAWNALIIEYAYEKEFDKLGLSVTDAEVVDMVQGNNINPQIKQFFADPNTGQFSRENVISFLQQMNQAPAQQRASWLSFEATLRPNRKIEKFSNLVETTNYVTAAEARSKYQSQTANVTADYLYVPFLSVADSLFEVTEAEMEEYLSENSEQYQREESRSLQYVAFQIVPSSEDTAFVKEEIERLKTGLADAKNDSTYAAINSDGFSPFRSVSDTSLLPQGLKDAEVGTVTEPMLSGNRYVVYKLSNVVNDTIYKIASIEKQLFESDETLNEIYRQADLLAANSTDAESLKTAAEAAGKTVRSASNVGKNDSRVGILPDARNVVLWLYNEASVNEVSDVFELNNNYVVAVMTSRQMKGTAKLSQVEPEIRAKVLNQKKAAYIKEKLQGDNIQAMADAYGEGARTGTEDISLSSNSVPGVGFAPEAVGVAFSMDEGEKTAPFETPSGVLVLQVTAKGVVEDLDDYSAYVPILQNERRGRQTAIANFPLSFYPVVVPEKLDNAIREFADIEDKRYKFF